MYITTKVLKIGYFGEPGSNAENAARGHFGFRKKQNEFNIEYISFATIEDLLEALIQQLIDKAVVPIETSSEGLVTFSADAMINGNGIVIEEEIISRIRLNLIGVGTIEEVEKIISIPPALSQCRKNIRNLGRSIKTEGTGSTSAAVREVAENNDPKVAAIGSVQALEIYRLKNPKLKILVENIQDMEKNQTRFFVMGHENKARTGKDKTSIIFGVEDKFGKLVDVLLVFKALGINMSHISSRPLQTELGEYLFWVDIDGHKEDDNIRVVLKRIAEITLFSKVLGSYPKAG